mmetsp:Transcript_1241/g.2844  ORF Transcript_1241/g.2844 Transcript_1241/m.2844 type:complete len:444 (-) Transcript_1241:85-1416(-)
MAAIALAGYEYEKYTGNDQQQQQQEQQQLRGMSSSSSSAQVYQLPQQLQQQQPQNTYMLLDQSSMGQMPQQSYGSSQQQALPKQELSLQELSPFPESVFSYTLFLASGICVWVLYLLLPRGVRKQYFRANRKRYARRMDDAMPAAGYWAPVNALKAQSTSTTPGFEHNSGAHQRFTSPVIAAAAARHQKQQHNVPNNIHTSPNHHTPLSNPSLSPPRTSHQANLLKHPPSPEHPALKKIPPNKIIAETMARLQGRGIRLVAHGVHCDPKRVWIRLQEEQTGEPSVTWQTEFPRRVPDQNGNVSIVLMRGSLHSIALKNILYIDVGKKTHALALAKGVSETMCLSLLTQNGSLDLQANSKLERDSLVSCFSMILDDIHEEDWRALYEASPEPSLANSSTVFSSGGHSLLGTANRLAFESMNTPSSRGNPKLAALEEKDRMLQLL